MGVIQEFFNNREIAIGIWVIIGLAVILPTKPARQFIKTAIPILFCKKFVIFYIVFLSFLGLVLFALNWAGLWDLTLLKDTVFWVLFVELPLFAKAIEKADGGRWYNQTHVQYYVNKRGDVVPDRTSHLAWLCNEHSSGKVIRRIQEIYSHIFIDELQDYAGWDLEVITLLFKSKIPITCVGDYKQATYRTNNSLKNKQYRDEKVRAYFLMLEAQGLCVTSYANTTRRFNQEICDFINTIHGDADSMVEPDPNNQQEMPVENSGVYMMNVDSLREYCEYYHPIILRYDKKAKVSFQHDCDVFNYGGSKGATYERVVIIPVSTTLPFIERQVKITSNQTRAKFYVACTRAKHSVVFAMENPCENGVFKATDIHFSDKSIPAYKFSKPDSDI